MKHRFLAALLTTPALVAQSLVSAKAGFISYVEGEVCVDDRVVNLPEGQGLQLQDSAVVRTSNGRAEVLMGPNSTLRIGENSSFRLVTSDSADSRIELISGSVVVTIDSPAKEVKLTLVVDTDAVVLAYAGFYHFDTGPLRLRVFAGQAEAQRADQQFRIARGRELSLGKTVSIEKFDKRNMSRLDEWSWHRSKLLGASKPAHSNNSWHPIDPKNIERMGKVPPYDQ